MAYIFPSAEWTEQFNNAINSSDAYASAAKNWEGDIILVIDGEGGIYLDLWHGECREASAITDENEKSPKYRIFGPFTNMRQILDKKVDPVQSMMTGKIKVKGDMAQIMKMPRAAVELVNCMTAFETVFPD